MRLLILLILLTFSPCLYSETVIQGGVEKIHTIHQARDAAFDNTPQRVDVSIYARLDKDFIKHHQAKINKTQCFPDRILFLNQNGAYAISFIGEYVSFYYMPNGQLYWVSFATSPTGLSLEGKDQKYPFKRSVYSYPSGQLVSTQIGVAALEDYGFLPSGELYLYCKDDNCFNAAGEFTGRRSHKMPCLK